MSRATITKAAPMQAMASRTRNRRMSGSKILVPGSRVADSVAPSRTSASARARVPRPGVRGHALGWYDVDTFIHSPSSVPPWMHMTPCRGWVLQEYLFLAT